MPFGGGCVFCCFFVVLLWDRSFVRSFVRPFVCLTRQIFITRVFKAKQRERERTKNETKKPGQGRFLEQ